MKKSAPYIFPLLLVIYETITYLSNDLYLPALPQMMHELNTSYLLAQMTLTLWILGAASLQFIMGPLSDRYGRHPVLFAGGIIFILSTLACALTFNIYILLIARFFQGSAVCSVIVAGYATIHELFDQKKAIQTLAFMSSITILAPALGPLLGGAILIISDWRFLFWITAIVAILVLSALYQVMPETCSAEKKLPIETRLLLINYSKILKNRQFISHTLISCMLFAGLITWIAAGPFLVITHFKRSVLEFGVLQLLIFGGFTLSTRFIAPLITKLGIQRMIYIGICLAACGAILSIFFAVLFATHLLPITISLMIYSVGTGLTFAPLQRVAIEASTESMGLKMAVFSTMISLFGVMASALVSIFYNGQLISLAALVGIFGILALVIYLICNIKTAKAK